MERQKAEKIVALLAVVLMVAGLVEAAPIILIVTGVIGVLIHLGMLDDDIGTSLLNILRKIVLAILHLAEEVVLMEKPEMKEE